jgi:hypothetical protein
MVAAIASPRYDGRPTSMVKKRYAILGWLTLKGAKVLARRKVKSGGRKWRGGR